MTKKRIFIRTIRLPPLRLLVFSFFFLTFSGMAIALYSSAPAVTTPTPAVVMIDPGHGGYDPGVKVDGLHEADLTLEIAKRLQAALQAQGISAALTRSDDSDFADSGTRGRSSKRTDLDRRIELTQAAGAKVFVSLHANVSSVASRGGAEVFYYEETEGAEALALNVQRELHKLPEMSKRDAKNAPFYLLKNQEIPALIIECGYLNFPDERARLTSADYQDAIAGAIAAGIARTLQKEEGP